MKKVLVILIIIAVVVLLLIFIDGDESNTPVDTAADVTPEDVDTLQWLTYKSEKYSFEFQYPPGSTVREEDDLNYQYIRLQNYSEVEDRPTLLPMEYYLEIDIYDHEMGHDMETTCENVLVDPREVKMGVIDGHRGLGHEGGDAGGIRFALCAQYPDVDFYIQGTENDEDAPLVKLILDSFKFF